jgi:hypothetical protein
MCWLLAAVVVVALVAVEQLYRLLLLHLVAVAAVVEEEQNCGFLLRPLALLKQSLWVLVVLKALLKQQMILAVTAALMETTHCLGHGRLLEVLTVVVVALQPVEVLEQAVGVWEKLLRVQLRTPLAAALEAQQAEVLLAVEDIDPVAGAVLLDLQQV